MHRALLIQQSDSLHHDMDTLSVQCLEACSATGFQTECIDIQQSTLQSALLPPTQAGYSISVAIFRIHNMSYEELGQLLQVARTISKQIFLCVVSAHFADDPRGRHICIQHGASMVTNCIRDVHEVLHFISSCYPQDQMPNYDDRSRGRSSNGWLHPSDRRYHHNSRDQRRYTCPYCARSGLSEDQLWRHCPLFHINERNTTRLTCPICREIPRSPLQVHMHNAHGPPGRGEKPSEFHMSDSNLYAFALVVCRHPQTKKFLLVHEFGNSGFWLPGGRVDPGENPAEAAIRETKEEAGVHVRLTGVIKIEYHPKSDRSKNSGRENHYVRMRFILTAEPVDVNEPPKSIPDYESAGATWCPLEEVEKLPLRGPEPVVFFRHVAEGKPVYPLDLMDWSFRQS